MTLVECDNCGESKNLPPSKAARSDNHFCDSQCYGEWNSGENNPRWNREEVSCANCGEIKEVPQKDITDHNRYFCDYQCSAEWQSENKIGKDHPKWKEDAKRALDYGDKWTQRRREFVEDTENVCCRCDSPTEELDSDLHVHHILRPESFDDINSAHKERNMMMLCRKCHPVVENMEVEDQFNYHPSSDGEWVNG